MSSAAGLPGFRNHRIAFAMAGVAVHAVVCLMLVRHGYAEATAPAFYPLLGVWGLGLLALLALDEATVGVHGSAVSFTQALWCNVGVVLIALLVPHAARLLLLVVALFGIFYAALNLDRHRTVLVALITWMVYVSGALGVNLVKAADPWQELWLALAFTLMLGTMLLMAVEVTSLRRAFVRRQERLNDALRQLSELVMRDDLTGLYNRRYIMDVLAQQKALADRGHIGFTLCYCDLDHFKRLNDRFGHHAGDRVLQEFAGIVASVVRSVDYVARIGGEEFLMLLVGADQAEAEGVARRLRARTRELTVAPDAADYRLTVSTGIAAFRPGERVEDVIQRADLALYRAKSGGRDQIVTSS